MNRKGITVKDVQEYLGLGSVQSVYHWLSGRSVPSVDNLYALSELFRVPMDNLICGNRRTVPMAVPYAAYEKHWWRMYIYYAKISEKYIA